MFYPVKAKKPSASMMAGMIPLAVLVGLVEVVPIGKYWFEWGAEVVGCKVLAPGADQLDSAGKSFSPVLVEPVGGSVAR